MAELCEDLQKFTTENIIHKSNYIKFECEECIKTKGWWVHLRICQTCGKMLCCDSSPNQHATKHAHGEKHNVASSAEMGENWLWCYKHVLQKNL